jgi:predicted Fe-Mo cluster-binding NifX family protein
MRVCIPTTSDAGLSARLSPHFGRAPYYTVVDTDTWAMHAVPNASAEHGHGECRPLAGMQGYAADVVVCRGLGRNALEGLRSGGVEVYVSTEWDVSGALGRFLAGDLEAVTSEEVCHGSH